MFLSSAFCLFLFHGVDSLFVAGGIRTKLATHAELTTGGRSGLLSFSDVFFHFVCLFLSLQQFLELSERTIARGRKQDVDVDLYFYRGQARNLYLLFTNIEIFLNLTDAVDGDDAFELYQVRKMFRIIV